MPAGSPAGAPGQLTVAVSVTGWFGAAGFGVPFTVVVVVVCAMAGCAKATIAASAAPTTATRRISVL
ncbi:hypothetical protein GTS_50450 [Gandjariella thermophila]|uniref:Uncharacterized protein n=1 Tax=Gandjariella thermophila TaxID=1931992 RepID=A0A4D4JDC9_9PSEU|nr:hypothetical protein GTS_50450 [Gandjariella thermophila]